MNATIAKHLSPWTPARFRADFLKANHPAGRRRAAWGRK